VAVKIRLKRMGKIRAPYYRIVVADSRTKRDGRVIEEIGKYHPTENPSVIEVNSERAQYWLGVGAQPTEQVTALLKLTGDWGQFKGEKGAKSTVLFAEPKPEFQADTKKKPVLRPKAVKPVQEAPAAEAPADVAGEAPVEAVAPTEEPPAETPAAEAPAAEEAPAADETAVAPEAPVEEAAFEEAPVAEEAPAVEEAPAAEAPVEEAPAAEEAPATDEAPAEETK
jgi:small subunit ribosomal protein S16